LLYGAGGAIARCHDNDDDDECSVLTDAVDDEPMLVLVKAFEAGKVNTGVAESNGSLLMGF